VQAYKLNPGGAVWVVQSGWGVGLPEDLRRHFAEFHDLRFDSFGDNIKIFKLTVGQPMPVLSAMAFLTQNPKTEPKQTRVILGRAV
jgi:hypothetical protein